MELLSMLHGRAFERDREFRKLVARERDVDLTRAALELARDEDPDLDFEPTLKWIQARAGELTSTIARARHESDALRDVAHCLAESWGLHGDTDCYSRPDSSYINRVVETTRGIPIALSVVYIAVASKLGLELSGVAAPMRFLARLDCAEGTLFVDAFAYGRVLTEIECVQWLQTISRLSEEDVTRSLQPADPRTIIIRMLNNLKALFARKEQWTSALKVQQRLAALQPATFAERRDLALVTLRANQPGEAIDLLQSCLSMCSDNERPVLELHLEEAKRQVSGWN